MLLNPTHEITLSGLPSDVLDAYVRYKKGTRAIVVWVVQYAPQEYAGARKLPIKELAKLVSSLAGRLKQLPDVIHFHFRETIAARRRLSKYFKGFRDEAADDIDTVNHEHFTTSLSSIYADLCAMCDQPRKACRDRPHSHEGGSQTSKLANIYEELMLEDSSSDDEVPPEMEECSDCHVDNIPVCPGLQKDLRLTGDELGDALEYVSALQEIHSIISTNQDCWRHVAMGDVHFVTAAFATNVAFASLLEVERRLRDLDEDISLDELQRRCCSLEPEPNGRTTTSAWHRTLQEVTRVHRTLEHHIDSHLVTVPADSGRLQRPDEFIGAEAEERPNKRLTAALIQNVVSMIQQKHAPSAIVRNSSPVYADLGYMLSNRTEDRSKLRLSFGLYLLISSLQTYAVSLPRPEILVSCRLTALKLAQAASSSVQEVLNDQSCFPCRCTQTIAFHLQHLQEDLTSFAKQKQWNLYFQSPYVSGSHILEVLDLCHYYGSKLLIYRHYIGALVHSYNVLHQLAGLEEIPLLEYLCEEYKERFFPGGNRPIRSFRASWTRYVGARLKFKKGHRRNRQDSWCMTVPPHAARRAAGLGVGSEQLAPGERSSMALVIKQQDYVVSDAHWAKVSEKGSSASTEHSDGHFSASAGLVSTVDLELTSSDTNNRPSSLMLNHFDVFRDCVKVVSSISNATHTEAKEKGMNCICFATAILEGGDRILEARSVGKLDRQGACWTKGEREGVLRQTQNAMKDVLGGKPASDWAWKL